MVNPQNPNTGERPILFSAPMVRALLAGTKTQTRRAAKPIKHPDLGNAYAPGALVLEGEPQHVIERACPFGQPGNRLWVREAMRYLPPENGARLGPLVYAADGVEFPGPVATPRTVSPIHMPRWASRITLEVTGVRVERLQAISEADATAEGASIDLLPSIKVPADSPMARKPMVFSNARDVFAALWESINGAGSWDANPWVWAIEFRRVPQ